MKLVKCHNQAQLDAAIKDADDGTIIGCYGDGYFEAYDSSTVRAYDSSTVTAYDSSTVTAYDSSTVRACGSSTVRAYDSSTVRACGSSTVTAYDSSTVRACGYVAVHVKSDHSSVEGGVQIKQPKIEDAKAWCDVYGADMAKGVITVYKAVDDKYQSPHGGNYTPGTTPVAEDWDGGKAECGGGLHFSPHPVMAMAYNEGATKFLACPVSVDDVVFHPDASMPQKIKARGCCAPVWEVDIDGNKVDSA